MESPLHAVRGVNNFLLVEDEKWRAVGLSKVLDTEPPICSQNGTVLLRLFLTTTASELPEVATDIRRRVHYLTSSTSSWKGPATHHRRAPPDFKGLMEDTKWENYGYGKDPAASTAMVPLRLRTLRRSWASTASSATASRC